MVVHCSIFRKVQLTELSSVTVALDAVFPQSTSSLLPHASSSLQCCFTDHPQPYHDVNWPVAGRCTWPPSSSMALGRNRLCTAHHSLHRLLSTYLSLHAAFSPRCRHTTAPSGTPPGPLVVAGVNDRRRTRTATSPWISSRSSKPTVLRLLELSLHQFDRAMNSAAALT